MRLPCHLFEHKSNHGLSELYLFINSMCYLKTVIKQWRVFYSSFFLLWKTASHHTHSDQTAGPDSVEARTRYLHQKSRDAHLNPVLAQFPVAPAALQSRSGPDARDESAAFRPYLKFGGGTETVYVLCCHRCSGVCFGNSSVTFRGGYRRCLLTGHVFGSLLFRHCDVKTR